MKKRLIFLFLTISLIVQSLHSQTFPVTLVPQVTPPAPIYFSSYANASSINSPLRLQIILNDLSQANREIKLKTYFEGNGISFQSKDVVIGGATLFIEGGIPLTLTNTELSPYFSYENITGIPPATYGQIIPEGSYQFCFEVYDVLTGARISQKTCASTFIFQNEPPLLIAPNNQIDVTEQNPLNLLFQWTPRHINVSNVQYELSIVEIWDQTINPQAAFLASPPVFQTTTTNTSYLYGPANPLFLSNKRYAWRVKAKALNGAEEIGLFKNNGYSEIYWFNYTSPCDTPDTVRHEVKGAQQVNVLWDDFTTDVPEFVVRYREKGNNNEWFTSRTSSNWLTIWDLRPGTTYEYQVLKKCLISESEYSISQTFTTPEESDETSLIDCGISPDMNIENMEPLEQLFPGDIFKAGDFPVKVTETNGSNGRFSGKGYVTFPYFNSIKVAVHFTNVFINNQKQLAEGMVMTVYDPKWGNILDVDEVIDAGEDIVDVFTGGDNDIITLTYDIETSDISIIDGQIVITKPDGTKDNRDYDEGDTYTITDASGDKWTIDKEGNITQTGKGDPSPPLTSANADGIQSGTHAGTIEDPYVDTIINDAVKVAFREHKENEAETRFALDQVNNSFETSTYSKIKTSDGNDYYPPHKAAVQGEDDVFYADIEISDSNINIDSLIIKTVKNSAIKHERLAGTNTYKITVSGINPYQNEECVITYLDSADKKYKIAASFFIHHIRKQKEIPVQVVTVNGGKNIPDFETELNKIYSRAGGNFKVKPEVIHLTIAQESWDDNNNNKIDYDGSGILSDYPTELKNIYKEFKKQYPGYDSQQYFVLVLSNEFTVSKPLSGFMPKTRQWGFIFESHLGEGLEKKDSALKVAAHELGHGAFTLEHPFGENLDNVGDASTWLMDYGDGTELGYPNWATMSDPSLKLMLFQEDSGGESTRVSQIPHEFKNVNGKFTFITLDGNFITLPSSIKDVYFFTGLDEFNRFTKFPTGALYSFVLDNKRYTAKSKHSDFPSKITQEDLLYSYEGFQTDKGEAFPLKEENKKYSNKVVMLLPRGKYKSLVAKEVLGLKWEQSTSINIINQYSKFSKFYEGREIEHKNYSYGASSPFDTTYDLNKEHIENVLGQEDDWNEKYLLVSKIAMLNNAYSKIIKNNFEILMSSVHLDDAYIVLKKKSIEELTTIYITLLNTVKTAGANCLNKLQQVTKEDKALGIINCIAQLSNQEIEKIPSDRKLILISMLLDDWHVNNEEEIQLIRLIKFTKKDNVDILLNGLLGKSLLSSTNNDKGFLIKELIYKTDNDHTFVHDDNYKDLIHTLVDLCTSKSSKFKRDLLNIPADQVVERYVKFYYNTLWEKAFADFILMYKVFSKDNILSYDTKVIWDTKNGSDLKIWTDRYIGNNHLDSSKPLSISPFSPIYFMNKSSLSMLKEYNQNKVSVSPSILAYYASDIGETKTIIDGANAVVDVVSLASGYGALAKAPSYARKAFIIADMIGSSVSLTTNIVGYENLEPETKAFVDALNILTLTVAVTDLAQGAKLKTIFNKVKNKGTDLPKENDIVDFLNKLILTKGKLEKLEKLNPEKIKEARVWLKQIELENALGNLDNISDINTKIDNARDILLSLGKLGNRIIAKTGKELKNHLNNLSDIPKGVTYKGDLIRSLGKQSEKLHNAKPEFMTDHTIYSSWGRYDLDKKENAMYLSKLVTGNKTEITHYGAWNDFNTYKLKDIRVDNILDLTDNSVLEKLGTELSQLTKTIDIPEGLPKIEMDKLKTEMYEFTNVIASWARDKGYNGIIAKGARGSKDYDNVIIFKQPYITQIIQGKTIQILDKTSGLWKPRFVDKLKNDYKNILQGYDNLPTNELKVIFKTDFENASESILRELNKTDSPLFEGWKNFRSKYPNEIMCTN